MMLEIEVKFYLSNLGAFQDQLESTGATFIKKSPEINIRFENQEKTLQRQKSLLRLRQDDHATLTYKSQSSQPSVDFKAHHEIEVMVDDFASMRQILESLGFHEEQTYEKIRSVWMIKETIVCVDIMPYGTFVEIEGDPEKIRAVASQLGFEWKNRILSNYLEMFEFLKQKLNLPFTDVTFKNFENTAVDFSKYLSYFASGQTSK